MLAWRMRGMDKYLQKNGVAIMTWQKVYLKRNPQKFGVKVVQEQEGWMWETCQSGNPNYMPRGTV